MFSISTVASSTSMPMARASPPSVIKLRVCPVSLRPRMPIKMAMGIEVQTTIVLRQLPTKARIIKATRAAAMAASRSTPRTAPRTKPDWSKSRRISIP